MGRLCALIVLGAMAVSAQEPACQIKVAELADAPELFGFRLGMTQEQAKQNVPQIKFGKADEFGLNKTSINPLYDSSFDKARFADVRTISLDFLDNKLVSLWIGYEKSFRWQTLDEFVPRISKSLHVPEQWTPKRGGRQLSCDGVSLMATLIAGSPSIRITEDSAQETIATRREEAAAAAEAIVVGDSRTKSYYRSDCSAPRDIPEGNRITFKNREEAEKAGFKPAKDCD